MRMYVQDTNQACHMSFNNLHSYFCLCHLGFSISLLPPGEPLEMEAEVGPMRSGCLTNNSRACMCFGERSWVSPNKEIQVGLSFDRVDGPRMTTERC